jgi:regulation of enolase protein 1 (concanavalin A-like superfamily)
MRKASCVTPSAWRALLAAVVASSLTLAAYAQDTHPLSDKWAGDKLDARWNVTVLGDAQDQESSVTVENGKLRIVAGGSDIWNDNDNGIFIWQPANGDFQVTLEIQGMQRTDPSSKLGIMVRSSLDITAANIFTQVMPKGGTMQGRAEAGATSGPGSGCPGDNCNPFGDPDEGDLGNQPTILQRLTRTGNTFKTDRSYDGGKTWVGLHTGSLAAQDQAELALSDDVLVGIAMTSHNTGEVATGIVGPISFTQNATRPTGNGLVAATAVDANGAPVYNAGLVVKKGSDVVLTSVGDVWVSNTTSAFLAPGAYTIEATESDAYAAGAPVPFTIEAGKSVVLKVPVGKAN